jgi:hypothetical protein
VIVLEMEFATLLMENVNVIKVLMEKIVKKDL